jgi:hypothetical protein
MIPRKMCLFFRDSTGRIPHNSTSGSLSVEVCGINEILLKRLGIENETGRMSRFAHPVVMSPTAKLRIPGHPGILATPPDEPRYGENRGKKSGCLRRSVGVMPCACREFHWGGVGWGGGNARTYARGGAHAVFGLSPIA